MKNERITNEGDAPELRALIPGATAPLQFWQTWSSPETFADYLTTATMYDCKNRGDSEFYGTDSLDEAIQIARDGWKKGAERASKLRDRINAANPMGPRVIRWDVAGAVASVPRALAGNPLNMRRVDTAKLRRRPVLTLISDMSANCRVNAKPIANRAAVIAAIIDAIESAGYSAHIIGFACGDADQEREQRRFLCATAISLKQPDQPADIARLAFGLGHPAMLRRLVFSSWTSQKWTEEYVGYHSAFPFSIATADDSQAIYALPGLNEHEQKFRDEETAATVGLKFFIETLRRQGCPAFPVDVHAAA